MHSLRTRQVSDELGVPLKNPSTLAHQAPAESQSSDDIPEQTRQDLLDARAMFKLRQDAVDTVMIANPVLKAVHNGTDATPVERHVYAPFVHVQHLPARAPAYRLPVTLFRT